MAEHDEFATRRPLSRRALLQLAGAAGLAGVPLLAGGTEAAAAPGAPAEAPASPDVAAGDVTPIRPPATPLAVRSPYISTWLAGDRLAGAWPTFWTGHVTAMTGIALVDGQPFVFMGAPGLPGSVPAMTQRSLTVTATRSTFVLEGGGARLTVTFLSPVEPGDVRRQSVPLSYVFLSAASVDGRAHDVRLYLDVSGEWASGDVASEITWRSGPLGDVFTHAYHLVNPQPLQQINELAAWGTLAWSISGAPGLSWQTGQDTVVRANALLGTLPNTADGDQPRAIGDRWPVFGLMTDLGQVLGETAPVVVSVGLIRDPGVSYLRTPLPPLWKTYWPRWQEMVRDFHADAADAQKRSAALDQRVHADASARGGEHYAALCALALRQAYGGTELVRGPDGRPWAFMKEISSSGNVSTVDVVYPSSPAFVYADPAYLRMLLEPLLAYPETGRWPRPYAEHDLGFIYPNATGHDDGMEEAMPVEESANMLIMTAAYLARASAGEARRFAKAHYKVLKGWADYLVPNALDPGFQNQTDDFTGFIAHSVNLACKGIVGLGAMSRIATAAGVPADAAHYLGTARDYAPRWAQMGQDGAAGHLRLAYDQPGTWSLKYNAFADRLLGLGLVPASVEQEEAAWYATRANRFGVPLDPRHTYTKTDWELWTAAWLESHPIRQTLIDAVYDFANTTPNRVPFTDWYETGTGTQVGFIARPVIGGVFSLLALPT